MNETRGPATQREWAAAIHGLDKPALDAIENALTHIYGGGATTLERMRMEQAWLIFRESILVELVQRARSGDEFVSGPDLEVRIGAAVLRMLREREARSNG